MRAFNKRRTTQGYLEHNICAEEYLDIYLYSLICKRHLDDNAFSVEDYCSFCLNSVLIDDYHEAVSPQDRIVTEAIEGFKQNNPEIVSDFIERYGIDYPPKVIVWDQRHHTQYYIGKLQESFLFEVYVYTLFYENGMDLHPFLTEEGQNTGENEKGVEIKNDMMYKTTNNIYIEYQEKADINNSVFVNSGILKDDNTKYFLIGDLDKFWIFEKRQLVQLFAREYNKKERGLPLTPGIRFSGNPTSRGMLLSVDRADQLTKSLNEVIAALQ